MFNFLTELLHRLICAPWKLNGNVNPPALVWNAHVRLCCVCAMTESLALPITVAPRQHWRPQNSAEVL